MKTECYTVEAEQILIKIAQIQRKLLDYVFDFETHELRPVEKPKRHLFRRTEVTQKEHLIYEIENLRQEAERHIPTSEGIRWWQISWSVIEAILYEALKEPRRDGGWRFETRLGSFPLEDGMRYVTLSEEGAAQHFSQEQIYQAETLSAYSEQEREERMARYDKAVKDNYISREFDFICSDADYIKSTLTEKVYDNMLDYYISEEMTLDSIYRSQYEDSMYTDKYTEGVSAQAAVRYRVKGLFAVGFYKSTASGRLLGFKSLDYHLLTISPDNLKHILCSRRNPGTAVLKLCEYLADNEDIRSIPFSLLSDIAGIAETEEETYLVALQSALFTLLAKKLTLP